MIFFPGISPKVMLRVLFPFIFTAIAIAAVLAAYIHFTDGMCSEIVRMEQEQAIRAAKSITRISMDDQMSGLMFNRYQSDGFVYLDLKPEFLGSFNLSEFVIVYPIYGNISEGVPFEEEFLAESALSSGSSVMRYLERGSGNSLLLFYPVLDSSGDTLVARMVFENVHGNENVSGKYNFYIISATAVILLILPGLFLKLANLRRQIEKNGFYQSEETVKTTSNNAGIITLGDYTSSFLNGFEFPALFRLDISGAVLYMNNSAEKLIDISKNDIRGAKFHELPCFTPDDQDLIKYPEHEEPSELILGIIDSSGNSRKAVFRVEMLGETGYVISVKDIGNQQENLPGTGESETDSQVHEVSAGSLSDSDIQRIRSYLEEGRMTFQGNQSFLDQLSRISDVLSGREKYHETQDQGQVKTIEIFSELEAISTALNDVLPERASIELDVPGFLPRVECSRGDFTQIVKNMVFYSLESTNGPVRINLGARDVPSPVSDSIFSANCDRTVSRSVSISFTDGTRIPVVLKEALLDPETDLSGIQRDYGSHVSSVAEVLSRLDCHPVFTEGSTGTTLNILFRTSEDYLFDVSHAESPDRISLSSMKLAICDASRAVRESVSDVLAMYGIDVVTAADLEEIKEMMADSEVNFLLLDHSAIDESIGEAVSGVRKGFPDLEIILTTGFSVNSGSVPEFPEPKVSILRKPYSTDELLNIIEMSASPGSVSKNVMNRTSGRNK
ncbi:MAG: hypothetical protein GQ565_09870 [Candidatus Aegiribacteria sp.]|nr:hypothetical protein [Candidatus Aegiribacteria sp.]